MERKRALGLAAAALAFGGCAAIGGLGDFHEVDCAGACDDGGEGGAPPPPPPDAPDDAPHVDRASIGGVVSGLSGKGLVLRDDGTDDLAIDANGPFVFATKIHDGDPYAVTVAAQPTGPSQTCTVTSGSGVVMGADVGSVKVDCATASYVVGGTVVGFSSGSAVLTNEGGDDLTVTKNGAFAFATKVASGAPYAVAVKTQPSVGGPCAVSGATGTVGGADVSSVVVNCAPGTYTVGGTVSGLDGTVTLQDNGGNDLTLSANGSFAFSQTLLPSATYAVTVSKQPAYPPHAQSCVVTSGSGTMGNANVTNVTVTCTTSTFSIGGNVSGLSGTLVLKDNGADALTITTSGAFTFPTKIASGGLYSVTIGTQPSGGTCSVASGAGTVTSANVTNVAVTCSGTTDPGTLCGATHCDPATQVCCVLNGTTPTCQTSCNGGGNLQYNCDDAPDCAAQGQPQNICCGTLSANGATALAIYCTQPNLCKNGKAYYCDPTSPNPCPNGGGPCAPTTAPSGYYRCY